MSFVPNPEIRKQINKVLSCYEGIFSIEFDPKRLEDGMFIIKLHGVPKENALKIWNKKD